METIITIFNTILYIATMLVILVFFIGVNIATIKEIRKAFREDEQRENELSKPVERATK